MRRCLTRGQASFRNRLWRWLSAPLQPMTCLSIVLGCGFALAASSTINDKPAAPPLESTEAQRYAQQLSRIIEQVGDKYVRPVSRAELATAALRGLYAAARLTVPPSLHAEVLKAAGDAYELHRLMARIRGSLGNPEPLRGPQALLASVQGMTEALDPFCAVLTGTELDRTESPGAQHRGLGLEANAALVPLVIKAVVPGGPAQKAGLRPGDQLTHINGKTVTSSFAGSARLFQEGTVQLRVYRPSTQTSWKVTIKPENFRAETALGVMRGPNNSWDYFIDREQHIAHVRLGSLERNTAADLARVLSQLTAAGMRGLILDLRWSPGGYLDEAKDVADLFLAGYVLPHLVLPAPGNLLAVADLYLGDHPKNATVVYRDRGRDDHHPPADPGFIHFPMIVLINAETSGAAELVAAVLQDNMRAKIAGQRSRGKGSVQVIQRLQEDLEVKGPLPRAALKLSCGMLIRPSGKSLNRFADSSWTDDWGVCPDPKLDFRISADLGRQLRDWWQLQDLRPGTSSESLPLDDPVADPQRQVALQALLDLLK
jgi:carboxyl-terminal processing protease